MFYKRSIKPLCAPFMVHTTEEYAPVYPFDKSALAAGVGPALRGFRGVEFNHKRGSRLSS